MSLWESTSLRIFTNKSCVVSFECQWTKSHGFCWCPVDLVVIDWLKSVLDVHSPQSRVHIESLRNVDSCLNHFFECVGFITCLLWFLSPLWEIHSFPFVCQRSWASVIFVSGWLEGRFECQTCLELSFKVFVSLISNFLHLVCSNYIISDQSLWVAGRLSCHRSDLLVHHGLSETGLINFVVAVESEANHVDQNIFFKLLPILYHKLGHPNYGLWIRSVDSQDRHAKWFNYIGWLLEWTVIIRVSRETDLVVGNDVHRSITSELGKLTQG